MGTMALHGKMPCCCRILEGKVVGRTCRRSSRSCRSCGRRHCCGRSSLGSCCIGISAHHTPCTEVVVPTSVVLTGINVERNGHLIAHLKIEFAKTILAKDVEHAFAGILLVGFYHEFLYFPRVSGTLRLTAARLCSYNDFACNFHFCQMSDSYELFVPKRTPQNGRRTP